MKNPPNEPAGTPSPRLLRRLGSNARRSMGNPEIAICGVFLVVLIALLVFEVSGRISLVLAVAMLWALGKLDRPARPKSAFQRELDADAKENDESRKRMAIWAARQRDEEEHPWE